MPEQRGEALPRPLRRWHPERPSEDRALTRSPLEAPRQLLQGEGTLPLPDVPPEAEFQELPSGQAPG